METHDCFAGWAGWNHGARGQRRAIREHHLLRPPSAPLARSGIPKVRSLSGNANARVGTTGRGWAEEDLGFPRIQMGLPTLHFLILDEMNLGAGNPAQ